MNETVFDDGNVKVHTRYRIGDHLVATSSETSSSPKEIVIEGVTVNTTISGVPFANYLYVTRDGKTTGTLSVHTVDYAYQLAPRAVSYVNVYSDGSTGLSYSSREKADSYAKQNLDPTRIAVMIINSNNQVTVEYV